MGSGSGQQSQVLLNIGGIILPMSHLNFDPALIHPTQCNVVPCAAEVDWIMEESGNAEKPEKQFRNFPPLSPPHCCARYTFPKTEKGRNVQRREASPLQKGMVENNILVLMRIIGMPDLDVNDH